MQPLKVMATIDGSLYEVEVKQTDPLHPHYEVIQDGKEIGKLNKANDKWFADEGSCLLPDDINAIGKAIDQRLSGKD
jgi:hypothetical protein